MQSLGLVGAAVEPDKGAYVLATERECIDRDFFCRRCANGLQFDGAAGLFQREETTQGYKVEDVDFQVATGACELAQCAITVQGDADVGTGQYVELARTVVYHHIRRTTAARNSAVDLHTQVAGAGAKALQPDKADAARCGFEGAEFACHAARWRVLGQYFGHQGQTKVNLLQAQAQCVGTGAVDAGKGVQAAAANGEQVGLDFGGGFGFGGVCGGHAVVEKEALAALFQREATRDLQEAKGVYLHARTGAQQAALRAVHAQLQRAADARGNRQRGLACTGGPAHKAVVHHRSTEGAGAVDFDLDVLRAHRQALDADQRCAGCAGLQAGPAACGCEYAGSRDFAHERKAKVNTGELQSDGAGRATTDAGKGVQVVRANAQYFCTGRAGVREAQVNRCAGFLYCEFAFNLHKAKDVQAQVPKGLGVLAACAVNAQCEAAGRAAQDRQLGLALSAAASL